MMSVNNGYVTDHNGHLNNGAGVPEGKNGYPMGTPGAFQNGAKMQSEDEFHDDPEQANRDREPLKFVKWITEKPAMFFGKSGYKA